MKKSSPERLPREVVSHVAGTCLCLHTQRAARALARLFDQALSPFELTNGQFSLLMALNQPEPPTMGQVAPFLAMDRTSLTAALKPLERRGLVRIEAAEADRRNRLLIITLAGVQTLRAALPVWRMTHAALEAGLPASLPDHLRAGMIAMSRVAHPLPPARSKSTRQP
jgi:DNA-binding MarR family transcriptional regulator